jgi:hypothetical protein
MVIPQVRTSRQRSNFIRNTHRKVKRELQREMNFLFGKAQRGNVQPLPMRQPRLPTQQELAAYW